MSQRSSGASLVSEAPPGISLCSQGQEHPFWAWGGGGGWLGEHRARAWETWASCAGLGNMGFINILSYQVTKTC